MGFLAIKQGRERDIVMMLLCLSSWMMSLESVLEGGDGSGLHKTGETGAAQQ